GGRTTLRARRARAVVERRVVGAWVVAKRERAHIVKRRAPGRAAHRQVEEGSTQAGHENVALEAAVLREGAGRKGLEPGARVGEERRALLERRWRIVGQPTVVLVHPERHAQVPREGGRD